MMRPVLFDIRWCIEKDAILVLRTRILVQLILRGPLSYLLFRIGFIRVRATVTVVAVVMVFRTVVVKRRRRLYRTAARTLIKTSSSSRSRCLVSRNLPSRRRRLALRSAAAEARQVWTRSRRSWRLRLAAEKVCRFSFLLGFQCSHEKTLTKNCFLCVRFIDFTKLLCL